MKKVITILCICLLLTGCGEVAESANEATYETESEDKQMEDTNMFVYVQRHDFFEGRDYDVVYHKDTKVMYAISHGKYNTGNFTLLVNADGTPMVYEESEVQE